MARRIELGPKSSHGLDICFEIRDGRRSIDAVVEVHDVAAPATGFEAAERRGANLVGRAGTQNLFIDVALKHQIRIGVPRRGEIMAGPKADHVGACLSHPFEVRPLLHEQDARTTGRLCEHLSMVRLGPCLIFVGRQHSRPRIEELIRIGSQGE